jgi:hypothetical protein
MEYNLVEIWLRRDPTRWIAGALGGVFAAVVAMVVAMVIAQSAGYEVWLPIKLMGTPILGAAATEIGNTSGILAGAFLTGMICVFWGVIFAHFTGTNSVSALLAMGLVWGTFSWIFIWNLFLPSFTTIFAARISAGAAFPVCIAYGLALASVAFIDPVLRGSKQISSSR